MAWDFTTDPRFQAQLDWADAFVSTQVEPLDAVIPNPRDVRDPVRRALLPPLQAQVRTRGLWSAHLAGEFGGAGLGHLELALLNEILGRSRTAPVVFGCQAPDSGNAQILARYGTEAHRQNYLRPLLDGEIASCFSATEPRGGADPTGFRTTAVLEDDHWVVNGEKWFSSGAEYAAFLIVMAVTEPDGAPHERLSMLIVPRETPGIRVVRNVATGVDEHAVHSYLGYEDVRVPAENLLGPRGGAFRVLQARMGPARLALATRGLGQLERAVHLMCERALSRETKGEVLAEKQLVQAMIAESWLDYETFRLLVLRTAWRLDHDDEASCRADIAAVKAMLPRVLGRVGQRAAQIHGSLGVSREMPFVEMVTSAMSVGVADGPTEVHIAALARAVLADHEPNPDLFPSYHLPALRERARELYGDLLHRYGRA